MNHLARMTRILWVLVLVVFVVGGWLYVDAQRYNYRQNIEQTLQGIARLKTRSIVDWRANRLRDAEMLALNPVLRSSIRDLVEAKNAVSGSGYEKLVMVVHEQILPMQLTYEYKNIRIVDRSGQDVVALVSCCSADPDPSGLDVKTVQEAWRIRQPVLGKLHLDSDLLPIMEVAAPLFVGESEERYGLSLVLVVDPRLEFYPSLQDIPIPSQTYESLLVRREGETIRFLSPLRHLDALPLTHTLPMSSPILPAAMGLRGVEGVVQGNDYRDVPVLAVSTHLPGTEWVLIVKMDEAEALSILSQHMTMAVFGGGMVCFAILAIALLSRSQAKLARQEELQHFTDEKLAQESRMASVLRAAPIGIGIIRAGHLVEMNEALCVKIGYAYDELVGQPFRFLFPSQEDYEAINMGVENHIDLGVYSCETRLKRYKAEPFDALVNVAVTEGLDGQDHGGLCFTVTDITEQKQQEQRLSSQAVELERSNADLMTFAYVASHDLRSPLRGISQLADWIQQDMQGDVPEEVAGYLDLMGKRIHRMEHLLDDLLEYSRVGRIEGDFETIDLAEICRDCFEMSAPPEEYTLKVNCDLPLVCTLTTPLTIILRNLLGNAVKHRLKDDGVSTVTITEQSADYCIRVSDDGPGIPERFHKRIFALFQTLKPRDEVEGSGMGLAIIRRILDTYDGAISVDSDGHSGTTFTVIWPKEAKLRRILDARKK